MAGNVLMANLSTVADISAKSANGIFRVNASPIDIWLHLAGTCLVMPHRTPICTIPDVSSQSMTLESVATIRRNCR